MTTMMMSASVLEVRERLAAIIYEHPFLPDVLACGCEPMLVRQQEGWADHVADMLIESALGGTPTPTPEPTTPPTAPPPPGLAAVWEALQAMAWLHAELAHNHAELERKHAGLVAEIQTLMQQAMGPTGMDPQRLQEFRQRAVRIARIRAAQNPTV